MASLRDIRQRILSVQNTRQITSAMKLVSGAKLRRATEAAEAARPYQENLTEVLGRLAAGSGDVELPLLQVHEVKKNVAFVVFTSDKGLCAGFNNNLLRNIEHRIDQRVRDGQDVQVFVFGKKARDYLLKRKYNVVDSKINLRPSEFVPETRALAVKLRAAYTKGTLDEVVLVYNRFVNVVIQKPTAFRLLPVVMEQGEQNADYCFEPNSQVILGTLLPLYVDTVLNQAMLETEAGEHAARMTAMENATRNATDIIDKLTLQYNRARQAAITTELVEIVSGAEAL